LNVANMSAGRFSTTEAERSVRIDLAACYRLVALFGWDDVIYTHISARVPGAEHHFLINPYGMMFEEIRASDLVKIDLQGNQVDGPPAQVNAAGFVIHSAIHMKRGDAQCVLHLHTPDGVAISALAEGILPLNQSAIVVASDVAFHDYEGPALLLDERERLTADMGEKNALILRNHGTLTVGTSVAEAFMRMYALERACTMQVRTLAAGRPLHMTSAAAIASTVRAGQNERFRTEMRTLAWPALLRKLDRIDTGYRD
jgi:ribulose-5-phosphate 4-epimerase/fuculose-1-phosphate aldolase